MKVCAITGSTGVLGRKALKILPFKFLKFKGNIENYNWMFGCNNYNIAQGGLYGKEITLKRSEPYGFADWSFLGGYFCAEGNQEDPDSPHIISGDNANLNSCVH